MGLYKELDYWSIIDKLQEIMEGRYNSRFNNSEYAAYYDELLTELANVASDLWNDLESFKCEIYNRDIPFKTRKYIEEDIETENASWWLNTTMLTLSETDTDTLFYREEIFSDVEKEKRSGRTYLKSFPKRILCGLCRLDVAWPSDIWKSVGHGIPSLVSLMSWT
jgi:hypothetical protein